MQALWINYDIVLDDEIVSLLDACGIVGFTRWPRLSGRGPNSGARLDNHVWPGANAAIMTIQQDDVIADLMRRLQKMRDRMGKKTGVWACTMPVLATLR